jgi:hypothetical protein
VVRTRRAGNQVFYSIDDTHVAALFREALHHLDHVRRNLPDHPYPLPAAAHAVEPVPEPMSESS